MIRNRGNIGKSENIFGSKVLRFVEWNNKIENLHVVLFTYLSFYCRYARYGQQQNSSRTTWGRRESYGGMGVVEVNNEPYKNNVQKGTHHYGSGTCPIPRFARFTF